MTVPIFPLNSVVLPGGRIPLQLFEPRYIDMLTRCLKDDQGFVITLLRDGAETGRVASFYDIGTYVRIIDFQQLENGLLGITVEGEAKVAITQSWRQDDGLNLGEMEFLPVESSGDIPSVFHELPSVLRALFRHPVIQELGMSVDYAEARDVSWRLTELLPLDKQEKQHLLEMQDPLARLSRLQELLEALEEG
ncbi:MULTISPECIES: LON peptidase substrate-binding domain-containing protein [unclassified Marinobacter]|uniref:LON peptidase substrate-binding domain-containing protein n=1 Tax=unclassified Marinobacter TaxID=83889 RepID=UPI0026E4964B|nr:MULTISPECIES: LON peptidase substrate-binding domain-containing protein [unclassified Marinobacter]MDO6441219.1 LON peptidase substrate-binding domain-containing protein [Marinobacter sp. 2_MG-2023]MDO6825356.1 LON peptidase substrate-binding domain-containing protein [Marinobacter sp. 1_MG-2023]